MDRLLVIGNFDGVHRGHQTVLRGAADDARSLGLELLILTFHPHPAKVLRGAGPATLTTLPRKLELLARVVPEATVVVEVFDRAWASQSPAEFAARIVTETYRAKVVVVGKNFRFGHERAGDFQALTELGARLGFEARSHAMVSDAGGPLSSSRVREMIARGDAEGAASILGRPHALSGAVVEGDKRGRTIGFPTCNVAQIEEGLPAFGVYAVLVDRLVGASGASGAPSASSARGATALAKGVANIGVRPTVKGASAAPSVEVHLFDFEGDLYGAELRVHLASRIREERRFSGLAELKEQIAKDAASARSSLLEAAPDASAGGAWW